MILPVSFESVLSLIPSAKTLPPDIVYAQTPVIESGFSSANDVINPILLETMAPKVENSINPMQVAVFVATVVWLAGIGIMLLYATISYWRICRRVREAMPLSKRVYLCDGISTPFILGILRPRIYLPSSLEEAQREYVIAHEQAHLQRRDHWWKPLGFALLTLYWFHPLLWVAYVVLCRDIEMACDERVIKDMSQEEKTAYSKTLLECSLPRRMISACPLAFGEIGVKSRIKAVLNYKKPAFWVVLAASVLSVVAAVCLLTDPVGKGEAPAVSTPEKTDPPVTNTVEKTPLGDLITQPPAMQKIDPRSVLTDEFFNPPEGKHFHLVFHFDDGEDDIWGDATLSLRNDLRGQVSTSLASSYLGIGTYTWDGHTLIFTTDDDHYKLVFEATEEGFICKKGEENGKAYGIMFYSPNDDLFQLQRVDMEPVLTNGIYSGAYVDVDGDGVDEHCYLEKGETDREFVFSAWDDKKNEWEYKKTYSVPFTDLSFEKNGDSNLVKLTNGTQSHFYQIGLEQGEIVLSENGVALK